MTFAGRLWGLGFASYEAYLQSKLWKDFKSRYRAAGGKMECAVCRGGNVELHHTTYVRLGAELVTDVMPLCGEHHEQVHAWLKATGRNVGDSRLAVHRLRMGFVHRKMEEQQREEPQEPPSPPKKQKKEKNRKKATNYSGPAQTPKKRDRLKSRPSKKHVAAKDAAATALAQYRANKPLFVVKNSFV